MQPAETHVIMDKTGNTSNGGYSAQAWKRVVDWVFAIIRSRGCVCGATRGGEQGA